MSEKQPASPSKELYGDYKSAVDRYNSYAQPSFKNMVRRALVGGNYQIWEADAHNDKIDAQKAAREDLEQHYEERVQEAINDFNNDPANKGKELNLPENGPVKMAVNVKQAPTPDHSKHG